jgi:hypothetical protein
MDGNTYQTTESELADYWSINIGYQLQSRYYTLRCGAFHLLFERCCPSENVEENSN